MTAAGSTRIIDTLISVLRKSYDEKSLGNLARWNFETRDQGGNNASGIAAEDEGTDKWTRSRNQTTKQANTSTIHDMIKAIILAIGNWPSGDKVPDAVRSGKYLQPILSPPAVIAEI